MEGAADAAAAAAAGGSGAAGATTAAAAAGALEAHPSASSLTLHLPLGPVVAPPVSRGNASDPSAFAAAAAAGTEPTSSRNPQSPRMTRSSSSRQYCAATLRRPGTEVWTWGRGDCGQLATGSLEDSPVPAVVKGLRGRNILNLAAGAFDTAVVTADGELYVAGSNDSAQLGIRQQENVLDPTRVQGLESRQVEQVACGALHTLALIDDGTVAAFGDNEFGQTGLESSGTQVHLPRVVKDVSSMHIMRLAAGGSHTLLLSSTGGVFSCGSAACGQLGRDTSKGAEVLRPVSRLWPLGVVQVAAGDAHSAALLVDGRLLTWGRGKYGALGLGDFENRSVPTLVRSLAGVAIRQVSCGDDHTALLAEDGTVYTMGRGTWGQTGHSHRDNTCLPQQVAALAGQRIVQVAAGGRHTLALADNNTLWAFGNNESGQLAAPASTAQPTPQVVQGLPRGCPILFVAAGGDHSAAVVDRHASTEAGSIGPCADRPHGEQCCAVQLPDLLQLAAEASATKGDPAAQKAKLEAVMAAVEAVFASPGYLLAACRRQRQRQRRRPSSEEQGLAGEEATAPMDSSPRAEQQEQQEGAADAGLAAGQEGHATHAQQTAAGPAAASQQQQQQPDDAGLDPQCIAAIYQALLKLYDADVAAVLGHTCVRLLDMLERFLNSLTQQQDYATATAGEGTAGEVARRRQDLSWVAPVLFILLQNPLNSDPSAFGSKVLVRISRIVGVTLPARERLPVRQALQRLLARLPADALAARCVRPVQRHLDACVAQGLGATRVQVLMAGVLLDVMRQANEDAGGLIPYSEFHNRSLSEHANLQAEYVLWRQNKDPSALCSLCQMPYLLTPEAKSRIIQGEAAMEQQQHLSSAAMQALFQGLNPEAVAYLHIHVRRTHVVEDALNQLVYRADDLKKPLRVTFVTGGVPEPAQDEGGVTKEFFMLLVRDLFKPEYAMFSYDEATRTFWFNPSTLESEIEYALVGAVLGLAIYNGQVLDVHFPMVVYKKLLGHKATFQDLKAAFPELGRGLQQLLDFEGDVESVFCRTFTADWRFWDELRTEELKPGGAHIPVTNDNRQEYVRLYTEWLLERSISQQFNAFRKGFLRVCNGPALGLFTAAELELLICGLPHLDFDALEAAANYEGYTRGDPVVRWFWQVLRGFTLEQKRAWLQFTTGSDRAPVGGLGRLPLLIQRSGPDTEHLPTAHTCFNALLLPEYSSMEKLRQKLLLAIGWAQGFGLK